MAIHKPFDFHFITLDGNTLTSGGTLSLAKGQVGVFDMHKQTPKGSSVATELNRKGTYTIKVGKSPVATTRSAQNAKPWSTVNFQLKDVRDAYVASPKVDEQKVDILLVGYDGVNASTALTFEKGDQTVLDVILSGDPIGELGYKDSYAIIKTYVDVAPDDTRTNQEIVEDLVENLKETTLLGGVPITNYIDITTIDSTKVASEGEGYTFSTLAITDEGGSNALARVQAQYPDYIIKRTDRSGLTSVYTILAPTGEVLTDYVTSLAQIIKGCEDCLAGYTEIAGGFVYNVNLEDDGADSTALVQALPGAVAGSAKKVGQNFGIGKYTVVVEAELTDAQVTTFVTANPTAEVILLGDVVSVCSNATETSIAWVAGEECFANVETYKIQVPDTDCGDSRLAELQLAYPELTIIEGAPSSSSQEVTLTGTSGDATITVNGSNYPVTFDTDLATTAAAFVTASASDIAAQDPSVTVTSAGAVLTFESSEGDVAVAVTAGTGDLAGTAASVIVTSEGGCQRVYSTTVATSVVCDECDPIFNDLFESEAPQDFDVHAWELVESAPSGAALMGIRIAGKPFVLDPDESLVDEVPFYETSIKLKAAGGYPTDTNVSFKEYNNPWHIEWVQRAQDRDSLGYNFRTFEEISRVYFDGAPRHECNNFAKVVLGEESLLKNRAQYVDYVIVVGKTNYAQEMAGREDTAIAYHIVAEVGRHQDVEALVNSIAVPAGLEPVQAYPEA